MQALLDTIAILPQPTDAARFFHGRGGLHPGCEAWALDAYPPVWLLTSFEPASEAQLHTIGQALAHRWQALCPDQPLNWVYQCRHGGRTDTRLMAGSVPEPHLVSELGSRYQVHLLRGQNHGLFLDMAEGRRWVRDHVVTHLASHAATHAARDVATPVAGQPGLRVLNLFAYTCAFSVVALQAGASEVLNIDMSAGALAIGQHNHRHNGVVDGARFLPHDLFNSWGKVQRSGPYDLVIVDPPSYQKGSFVAQKDYARVARRLPDLLAPGGLALLCLNAPELGSDFLHQVMAAEAPGLTLVQRLPNPASFADLQPERALKVLVYRRH